MSMTVLIAPSGFKESLDARACADCIAEGIVRVLGDVRILKAPMADGGEGFTTALVEATQGTQHALTVTGPVGQRVDAHFGFLGGRSRRTAVLEMAAAAGLRLVPRDRRDPTLTTSYGVGELIRAALDAGRRARAAGLRRFRNQRWRAPAWRRRWALGCWMPMAWSWDTVAASCCVCRASI